MKWRTNNTERKQFTDGTTIVILLAVYFTFLEQIPKPITFETTSPGQEKTGMLLTNDKS